MENRITLSEALAMLRRASREEVEDELAILLEEIGKLKEQINIRRNLIRTLKRTFKGPEESTPRKPRKADSGPADPASPSDLPNLCYDFLLKAGPASNHDLAHHFGTTPQMVYQTLRRQIGHRFQLVGKGLWLAIENVED